MRFCWRRCCCWKNQGLTEAQENEEKKIKQIPEQDFNFWNELPRQNGDSVEEY